MYLLNGESKHCIEFSDRGLQYGDGLFETIEVCHGVPVFLDQHLQRLKAGCKSLLIPPPNTELLREEAYQLAKDSNQAVLKLIVTRGSGGRGYRLPDAIVPNRLFSLHAYPDYPADHSTQGVNAIVCQTALGLNARLAGIKHLNRLEQVLARAEWNSPDIQEGLMMDCAGNIIEGTMTNVFLVKQGVIYTPLIDTAGVKGIIRQLIIQLARENNLQLIEKKLLLADFLSADEVFISNSIIGLWPLKKLHKLTLSVGPVCQTLQTLLQNYKQESICAQ